MSKSHRRNLDDVRFLLNRLEQHEASRAHLWRDFHEDLQDAEALRRNYAKAPGVWQTELMGWLDNTQVSLEARIGALRLLAFLAGTEESVWKGILLAIAIGDKQGFKGEVDLRAWSLYFLRQANLEINKDTWDDFGQPLVDKALKDVHAKVRQWAAYSLGEMAEAGSQAEETVQDSRLADEFAYQQVEQALTECWHGEIDAYVARQLVISLGQVGGHVAPAAKGVVRPIVSMLEDAASHPQQVVRYQVPEAVLQVGTTVRQQKDMPLEEQAATLKELMGVLAPWLQDPGLDYETYRSAITTIFKLISLSLEDTDGQNPSERYREIAAVGLDLLLGVAESAKIGPELRYAVQTRAVRAIGDLAKEANQATTELLGLHAVPRLKLMLASDDDTVAMQVTDSLINIMGSKEAAHFFADVVLKDDPATDATYRYLEISKGLWDRTWGELVDRILDQRTSGASSYTHVVEQLRQRTRERAARALGGIAEDSKKDAFNRLVAALQRQDGPEYTRARDALSIMGSVEAAGALIGAEKSRWLQDRFFGPIEKADQHGKEILSGTIWMSRVSWVFTLIVAAVVTGFGGWLLYASISKLVAADVVQWETIATGIAGAAASIVGLLAPFFWNSASAVQKGNAEMTKLVTAFHGYMGRMRLLGLGFADAYTKDKADASFLTTVSGAAGEAMIESVGVLTDISAWPGAKVKVRVPKGKELTWQDAEKEIKARALVITLKELAYDDEVAVNLVADQDPKADAEVEAGTSVAVTLSMGKKPKEDEENPSE